MDTNKVGKKPRGNSGIAEAGIATRFTPGQSGNPSGRPRRTPYPDAHRTVAQLPVVELGNSPDDSVAIRCTNLPKMIAFAFPVLRTTSR